MLRMASFPPDRDGMQDWFEKHEGEWHAGEAYRFAVEWNGRVIGLVDLDEISEGEGELGYWLERGSWGQGFAFEAAEAIVSFAFGEIGLSRLWSGHAVENAASGKILLKLGFLQQGEVRKPSLARGEEIAHRFYKLEPAK